MRVAGAQTVAVQMHVARAVMLVRVQVPLLPIERHGQGKPQRDQHQTDD